LDNRDKHWKEVLSLATKHGFLIQAHGGVATLATHEIQKEHFTEEKYHAIQKMQKNS